MRYEAQARTRAHAQASGEPLGGIAFAGLWDNARRAIPSFYPRTEAAIEEHLIAISLGGTK